MDNNTDFRHTDTFVNAYAAKNVFYIITMIIGIFGNILLICTILKNKFLRTPMNISLVSLSVSDLLVCACVLPIRLFLYSGTYDTSYTLTLCRADVFLKSMFDYLQPSLLVATSFEKYKSIAKPFENKAYGAKRIVVVITVTWCTCFCCGVVSAVLFRDGATYYPCSISGTVIQSNNRILNFREGYVTLPFGFSCIILICIFYILMMRTLRDHSKKMKTQFKGKAFKNKVKPASLKRETRSDSIPRKQIKKGKVMPVNSARFSRVSIQTESSKINHDSTVNAQELKKELLHVTDVNLAEEKSSSSDVKIDSKNECSSCEENPKIISINPTRDSVCAPLKENKQLPNLSVVAKRIILMKAHQRRSLNNMQKRESGLVLKPRYKSAPTSVIDNTEVYRDVQTDIHCDQNVEQVFKIEPDSKENDNNKTTLDMLQNGVATSNRNEVSANKQSVKMVADVDNSSSTVKLARFTTNQHVETRSDDIESISKYSPINTENKLQEIQTPVPKNTGQSDRKSHTLVEEVVETKTEIPQRGPENHNQNFDGKSLTPKEMVLTNVDEISVNTREESVKNVETRNDVAQTILESENNGIIHSNRKNVKVIDETEKNNSVHNDSKNVEMSDQKEEDKDKQTVNNVDIVDFDGTVHKDVKVEGASVVGAVCVMNKSNRLEGRRKVEMRAAKRIAVMLGSFVLLWLPSPLSVLYASSREQISFGDIEALLVSASVSATTVAFNPILNLFLNKQLRSAATVTLRKMANTMKRTRLN